MQNGDDYFHAISKEIVNIFGRIFATRPYVAILDGLGRIHYIDKPLSDQHLDFVQTFVKRNFTLLNVGDYSFPLGGINLGIFKISSKAVIILYTEKGFTGQLLAFKTRMHQWSPKIDELIGELEIPSQSIPNEIHTEVPEAIKPIKMKTRGFKELPVLLKKLTGKEKFPIEVAQILNLCNGEHSIEDICMETNYNIVKVKDIIQNYTKKKWIKTKRKME